MGVEPNTVGMQAQLASSGMQAHSFVIFRDRRVEVQTIEVAGPGVAPGERGL